MCSERRTLVCDRTVFVLSTTWRALIGKRNAEFTPWWTSSTQRISDPSSETAGCMRKTDQFRSVLSTMSWQVRRAVPLRNEYSTTWLYRPTYPLSEPYVPTWTWNIIILLFHYIWTILNTPVHSVECKIVIFCCCVMFNLEVSCNDSYAKLKLYNRCFTCNIVFHNIVHFDGVLYYLLTDYDVF